MSGQHRFATKAAQPSKALDPNAVDSSPFGTDSFFETVLGHRLAGSSRRVARWMGWRLRSLVGAALLGCIALFVLARLMASTPTVDGTWRATQSGEVQLLSTEQASLRPYVGQVLRGVRSAGSGDLMPIDAGTLKRSSRWIIDDAQRERQTQMHQQISTLMSSGQIEFFFASGESVRADATPRGFGSLPAVYWLLSAIALLLYLVGVVVLTARPSATNLMYALIALCQAGNLVFIATEATLALSLPAPWAALDFPIRLAFDFVTGAAIVTVCAFHPRRLAGAPAIAAAAWLMGAAWMALMLTDALTHLWWWAQAGVVAYGVVVLIMLTWPYRLQPHPFATVLRRFGLVIMATWVLLTVALATAVSNPSVHHNIASVGSMIWYVFFASVLLLVPFLSRSQQMLREFSLLAAVSTVATSLDLLFVAVFSLGQFASLTLSLFVSLALYAGARQWILNQLLGSGMLTTERMFEQLYRMVREVELHPERTASLLSKLLRELFEPLQLFELEREVSRAHVSSDGSTLLVPVPALSDAQDAAGQPGAIAIRFAQRGRRLFTQEDSRLTDRIVEQLMRAVAFEKAVEQGRSEERLRLAQDLHDDIGARLLTLMYKAPSPEMEEYVRHTLQDLKTLTRGLAAPSHRLSHAAAEWKSDLTQRLAAANVALEWTFDFDQDMMLSVVQWSALTRILRELVSNAIAHARTSRVEVALDLREDRLDLRVSDAGIGCQPASWSHGLGLGGVRKRVKQLGGEVEWREIEPQGIQCRVLIADLSTMS